MGGNVLPLRIVDDRTHWVCFHIFVFSYFCICWVYIFFVFWVWLDLVEDLVTQRI